MASNKQGADPEDLAARKLVELSLTPQAQHEEQITSLFGKPAGSVSSIITVGPRGPVLLQDDTLIEEVAHFDRERIPERAAHAKGAGAYGVFEVTKSDIQKYCKADLFSEVGKKTDVFVRFSTVTGERGSADTVRDPRGFAMKYYTNEGNWDLVCNNSPTFFVREPILFPSVIRSQKRNPQTNLRDANMFWDFLTLRPEATHSLMFLFGDRGIPDGFRHMDGFSINTYKMVNSDGVPHYVKFHMKTNQGIKNLQNEEAWRWEALDPEYSTRDLLNSILKGNHPSWTMKIQVMNYEQAEKCPFNPFDDTKVWPHNEFPLIEVGKMTLNRIPTNFFVEVEQVAFCPANFVPGIEASPDKVLQGRLFSYKDSQRHRLGPNFQKIEVNRPRCPVMHPTMHDSFGMHSIKDNGYNFPNYYPNSFYKAGTAPKFLNHTDHITGDITRYDSGDDDNFSQPAVLWTNVLSQDERKRLVSNIAVHVRNAAPFIQERVVKMFAQVHPDFGDMLQGGLDNFEEKEWTLLP